MKKSLFIIIALSLLSACGPLIYVENDAVTQAKHVKYKMSFSANEPMEPYYNQHVTIVKAIKKDEPASYLWYDVITLSARSFDLDLDKVYLIVDKDVFQLENTYERQQKRQNINEKKEEVLQSDSTKVSVITGYDMERENVFQMVHPVSQEIMERIVRAKSVVLRYSVGPDFINSEIIDYNLANLKKLIVEYKE